MKNLINFFIRYGTWFLFSFYVLVRCILLSLNSSYHHAIFLTSANSVSSSIYSVASDVSGYFNLKTVNESLMENNARLENEVLNLRHQISEYKTLLSSKGDSADIKDRFAYVPATVLNNSIRHPRNYFSINRGTSDGVQSGMGVLDQNGVVGIVNAAGKNTSRVISLLNETQRFSVKLKGTHFIGSLTWKGGDPTIAYMEEVPRHAKYHPGETVVTSGYSMTFPENIPIGVVMNRIRGADDNFYILKVKLNSDFKSLGTVRVIKDAYKADMDSLSYFDLEINGK